MTYLIAQNGRVNTVANVAKVEETFFDIIFTKEDGSIETFAKYDTDLLGRA